MYDPEIYKLIQLECQRQNNGINLIASENVCFPEVTEVIASCLTNKYAEGQPGNRFYGGCQFVDEVESIAQRRCLDLFVQDPSKWHANVQPHAGAQANLAVYKAFLKSGDTILAMDFNSGGHLTHGHPMSIVAQLYNIQTYTIDPTSQLIDYNDLEKKAKEHRPKIIIVGASSYSRIFDYQAIQEIARQVGALVMADIAHIAGLIAGHAMPSPFEYIDIATFTTHKTLRGPRGGCIIAKKEYQGLIDKAVMPGIQGGPFMNIIAGKAIGFLKNKEEEFKIYSKKIIENAKYMAELFINLGYKIISNGTDTHLFVIDLSHKNLTGLQAQQKLEEQNIFVNKQSIPFDTQRPLVTSGIRIGTPFITSQNKTIEELTRIVSRIDTILSSK